MATSTCNVTIIEQFDSLMEVKTSVCNDRINNSMCQLKFMNGKTTITLYADNNIELSNSNIIRADDAATCGVHIHAGRIIVPRIFSGRIFKYNPEGLLVNSITCKCEPYVYMWYDLTRRNVSMAFRHRTVTDRIPTLTREETKEVYLDLYGLDEYDIVTGVHANGVPSYSVDEANKVLTLYNMQARYKYMWNGNYVQESRMAIPVEYFEHNPRENMQNYMRGELHALGQYEEIFTQEGDEE